MLVDKHSYSVQVQVDFGYNYNYCYRCCFCCLQLCLRSLFPEITPDSAWSHTGLQREPLEIGEPGYFTDRMPFLNPANIVKVWKTEDITALS